MNASSRNQRRAMVVGLGKSGLSAARHLSEQGYSVAVTDSRDKPPQLDVLRKSLPDVAVFVGGFSEAALANADMVVVSPGVPLHDPFIERIRANGIELVGDIELFARIVRKPVIAVTGSNGKSTVATLVARMAEVSGRDAALGGNVGTPALELLGSDADVYVLELSSFQLESTHSLKAAAAVVLNVTPDHLDWHGSMESYAHAKARIYHNAGTCVFNRDDPWSSRLAQGLSNSVSFGTDAPQRKVDFGLVENAGRIWLAQGGDPLLPVDELRLTGAHNHANALACLALGAAINLPMPSMLDALRAFNGLPHRMEWVAENGGVVFVNDSKGTNVGATIAAVTGVDRPIVLIAGGQGKGQGFTALASAAIGKVRHVVLIGIDAPAIEAAINRRIPVSRAGSMKDAVRRAADIAQAGDMVLLSPACASLDMFSNYEARGQAFVHAVQELRT